MICMHKLYSSDDQISYYLCLTKMMDHFDLGAQMTYHDCYDYCEFYVLYDSSGSSDDLSQLSRIFCSDFISRCLILDWYAQYDEISVSLEIECIDFF